MDFHVISKLLAVDTEVDPPHQNRGINPLATIRVASGHLGGTTSVSSGTDAGEADMTNSR